MPFVNETNNQTRIIQLPKVLKMSKNKGVLLEVCDKTRIAAQTLWATEGFLSVPEAMEVAMFTPEETKDRSLQIRVRRAKDKVIPPWL